jgi:hypothetical protein
MALASPSPASSRVALADLLAELRRPPHALALPERGDPGQARRRRDEHAVARDLLDPPRRRAEDERLALPRLVDHLLVELADATAAVGEEDAEEAAVRDRPAFVTANRRAPVRPRIVPGGAVPDDSWPELRELVGRVAPGEHVEDVLELRA